MCGNSKPVKTERSKRTGFNDKRTRGGREKKKGELRVRKNVNREMDKRDGERKIGILTGI